MQSNNPVFRRSEEFHAGGANAYGHTRATRAARPLDVGDRRARCPGAAPTQAPPSTGPMTIDTVVQKTAITLGLVVLAAAATWVFTPSEPTTTRRLT